MLSLTSKHRIMLRIAGINALISSLLICVLLAGCETKKPLTTAKNQQQIPADSASSIDANKPIIAHRSLPDTAINNADHSRSEDVPALHEPFEEIRKVAPGLLVIINSIRPADTAIIRDPSDLKLVFTIKRNNKVIYRDTVNDGMAYSGYSMPEIEKLYPIWLPIGNGDGELLVAFTNRPSKDLARRFRIRNGQIAKVDTLLTFNGPAKDYDHDGKLEFAGYYDFGEEWDDKEGHHRMYNPTLYYELRPTGLFLDSALTKRKVRAEYGVFLGYKYSGEPGILVKTLPKNSIHRH